MEVEVHHVAEALTADDLVPEYPGDDPQVFEKYQRVLDLFPAQAELIG